MPPDNSDTKGFLAYLKAYTNGWVAAAVVLPTAITWKGIPVYESQRSTLVTLNALSCALILSFLFTSREFIPKTKTRIGRFASILISLVFIVLCGSSVATYLDLLDDSARIAQTDLGKGMRDLTMDQIPKGGVLMLFYILTVVSAECAFFFMAFREWKPGNADEPR
jgi:hypothetical protein